MTTTVQVYSETEAGIATLRQKYQRPYNCTDPKEMALAREARAEIKKHRVHLEKLRVEYKKPLLEQTRLLDDEARRITAELEAIEVPIDDAIKAEEHKAEAEKARKEEARAVASNAAMATANKMREAIAWSAGKTSAQIAATIEGLAGQKFPDDEHAATLETVRTQVRDQLGVLLSRVVATEEEDRRRAQERAELEKQKAELAAAQAKSDAERAAKDAESAKARAEADRTAREAREKEEQKLRAERAKLDGERDAAVAIAQKLKDDAEAKARAERAAAEEKARKVEEEKQRKLKGRELLKQFVALHKADAEFKEIAEEIHAWLEQTNTVQKKAVGK